VGRRCSGADLIIQLQEKREMLYIENPLWIGNESQSMALSSSHHKGGSMIVICTQGAAIMVWQDDESVGRRR